MGESITPCGTYKTVYFGECRRLPRDLEPALLNVLEMPRSYLYHLKFECFVSIAVLLVGNRCGSNFGKKLPMSPHSESVLFITNRSYPVKMCKK